MAMNRHSGYQQIRPAFLR